MQRVTLVRYAAKPDRADENQALSLEVFDELKTVRPDNIAYALFRDGVDFVHLFVNLRDDDSGVLTDLPTFQAFAKNVNDAQRSAAGSHPPEREAAGVLRPLAARPIRLSTLAQRGRLLRRRPRFACPG
jgi:hypothetical protein